MNLKSTGHVNSCMAHPSSYKSYIKGNPTSLTVAEHALRELQSAREKDLAAHEENLKTIEQNKVSRAHMIELATELGIPDSWKELDHKSRSRYPKHVTKRAGYLVDLERYFPLDDGFNGSTIVYNGLLKRYTEYHERALKEQLGIQADKEKADKEAEEKRKSDIELVKIILRYELPEMSTWEEVYDHLREKHSYIDLAFAMADTRADWSDGFYRVRAALDRFPIVNDLDQAIYNDVMSCMGDDDGRVFRDTTWNYDQIMLRVEDRQLLADALTARTQMEKENGYY